MGGGKGGGRSGRILTKQMQQGREGGRLSYMTAGKGCGCNEVAGYSGLAYEEGGGTSRGRHYWNSWESERHAGRRRKGRLK